VIGREFTRRPLERIADIQGQIEGLLRELKAIELICEKALFPELAYMFKHSLTHEVAYHSLLLQRRKELHRLIGLAIEELYAERLAEHYEVLAHHFVRAEDWTKALEYLMRSAEKAAMAFANREALAFYDQALEASRNLGDLANARILMTIHQARANLYFVLSDYEAARVEGHRSAALARQTGDSLGEAVALAGVGLASRWAHRFDEGIAYARQAIEIATDIDAKAVLATGQHRSVAPTEDQDCLLPVPAVAGLLAVPASYAYKLARQGKLPTIHLRKYVRVRASALTAWLDRRSADGFDGGAPTVTRTTAATPASRGRLTPAPGRRPWSSRTPRPERRRDRASILPPPPPGAAADDA
jgi:excisionase family DNA binding protein